MGWDFVADSTFTGNTFFQASAAKGVRPKQLITRRNTVVGPQNPAKLLE